MLYASPESLFTIPAAIPAAVPAMIEENEVIAEVGRRLETFRLSIEYKPSQAEAAQQLGVGKDVVGRVERGQRTADAVYLTRLAKAYDLSPTWVVTGRGPQSIDRIEELERRAAASPPPPQPDVFTHVFDAMSVVYEEMGIPFKPADLGARAGRAAAQMTVAGWDADRRAIYLEGVLDTLREELARDAAAPAASKRSA